MLRPAGQFRIFDDRILTFVGSTAGDRPNTRRRAAMLSSQVLGMCYCRCILQLPAVVELDLETIVASLARCCSTTPPETSRAYQRRSERQQRCCSG